MGSKGRFIPPHPRRPVPGPGMMHPDPFGPPIHPSRGAYPPFDMLPPSEVMEHKLDAQHVEMQRLATENQRLAATHAILRQELGFAQQELQKMQNHMGALNNEKDQHMRGVLEKMSKMEADLHAAEPITMELQTARANAESLAAARHELMTKAQHMSQDLQKIHSDCQQVSPLISEVEGLRQEFNHCRGTYDHEKKVYTEHYESLQLMENNYVNMAKELDKLRAELATAGNPEIRGYMENGTGRPYPVGQNSYESGYGPPQVMTNVANPERRGPPYGGLVGFKETEAPSHHPVGQSGYEDGFAVSQVHGLPTAPAAYAGVPPGPLLQPTAPTGYEVPPRGAGGYDPAQRGGAHPNYNIPYDPTQPPRGEGGSHPNYNIPYDPAQLPRGEGGAHPNYSIPYDPAKPPRGEGGAHPNLNIPYDPAQLPRGEGGSHPNFNNAYDPAQPPRGAAAGTHQGQVQTPQGNNNIPPYGSLSGTPPARVGGGNGGYEAQQPRGGNPNRR